MPNTPCRDAKHTVLRWSTHRREFPCLPNHQHQTVTEACGFCMKNHHALADAEACAWIAREIL